ncbi:FecR family protein [Sphingobacterium pedocola]|uniref:Anti-sigma factor n=1 Tax=Sphingobacterium pedocola TaxID=2082722 RepID=A0ABR9T7P5_9SPHI|nr:FecR domain-containing protein [Sphingobacterium pedocola]MBE8720894.1 anti-sigma factor [Sphingobacterium pedocola]
MKSKLFRFLTDRYQQEEVGEREKNLFDNWYESLDNRIQLPEVNNEARRHQSWRKVLDAIEDTAPVQRKSGLVFRRWLAGAAALLLAGIGLFYWNTPQEYQQEVAVAIAPVYRTITTEVGERKRVDLPDGSTITLNARSQLRFDENQYGRTTRTIELLSGEAFFDVAKDSSRAFIVQAGVLQTTVLGTSFNIRTYDEMPEQVISVFTGRVQVQRGQHMLGTLEKGQRIRFEKEHANSLTEEFDRGYSPSWTSGKVVLQDADFDELALAINNTYGIILQAGNAQIARQQYSMPIIKYVSVDEALRAIQSIHQNKIRKEGNTVILY